MLVDSSVVLVDSCVLLVDSCVHVDWQLWLWLSYHLQAHDAHHHSHTVPCPRCVLRCMRGHCSIQCFQKCWQEKSGLRSGTIWFPTIPPSFSSLSLPTSPPPGKRSSNALVRMILRWDPFNSLLLNEIFNLIKPKSKIYMFNITLLWMPCYLYCKAIDSNTQWEVLGRNVYFLHILILLHHSDIINVFIA